MTVLTLAGGLLLNTVPGYIFAKKEFYGRDPIFKLQTATLMTPVASVPIPFFQFISMFRFFKAWRVLVALPRRHHLAFMRCVSPQQPSTALMEVAKFDGGSELCMCWTVCGQLSISGFQFLACPRS